MTPNPIDLIGKGVSIGVGAARLAVSIPKTALSLLGLRDGRDEDPFEAARRVEAEDRFVATGRQPAPPSAPDPIVARPTPVTPRGHRRKRDVEPNGAPRWREPDADDGGTLVETEGAAAPHAQIRVDAPWDGYDAMKAADIVARVKAADMAAKAVVLLYEQTHKKRKSVIAACT